MPIRDVVTEDGTTIRVHSEQGFTCFDSVVQGVMPAKDLKLQFEWMKEMEIRDNDIMICAYPKAGTHWLWEVLSMLSKDHSEYETKRKESAMLEFLTKEMVASLPSPRVLNTHHTPSILPQGITERKCKIIHVMRNPKDICVSFYHHAIAMREKFSVYKDMTLPKYIRNFISEEPLGLPCNYFWFIKQFEKFKKDNPDYPILEIFYENMKTQPEEEIKRLAKFLGNDVSDELAKTIADNSKFDNMKKAKLEQKEGAPTVIYRKGQIGDWKNHFTVAENEMFDKWIAEQSQDSDIKFRYE